MRLIPTFLIFCAALVIDAAGAAASSRPNIVILCRRHGLRRPGHPESRVEDSDADLDRLAREGMRFTDAHSSSGICTPSRYALLTGRFHWRKFHDIVNSFDRPVLDLAEITLPGPATSCAVGQRACVRQTAPASGLFYSYATETKRPWPASIRRADSRHRRGVTM